MFTLVARDASNKSVSSHRASMFPKLLLFLLFSLLLLLMLLLLLLAFSFWLTISVSKKKSYVTFTATTLNIQQFKGHLIAHHLQPVTSLDPAKPVERILIHPQCLESAGDPKEPGGLFDADDAHNPHIFVEPQWNTDPIARHEDHIQQHRATEKDGTHLCAGRPHNAVLVKPSGDGKQ